MKNHAVILFVLSALFGAACSADVVDQTTSPIESAVESEATALTQASSATEPVAAAAEEDQEPVATVETSSAASLLGSDDWCTTAAQLENIIDPGDLSDPVALKESYGAAAALLGEAARTAPPAIASDVGAMAQAVVAFSSVLEEVEWVFLDVDLAALEEIGLGVEAASANVAEYNYEVCGIGEDTGAAPDFTLDDNDQG